MGMYSQLNFVVLNECGQKSFNIVIVSVYKYGLLLFLATKVPVSIM